MITTSISLLLFSVLSAAHGDHGQAPMSGPHKGLWYNTLPGDGGTQVRFGAEIKLDSN
jgi:agmatinase